ncbi:MAG: glycosyltransferase family 2 protein [Cytophagales bacterium]|nr:glycosyltransferase family 2 protein [Cytophaga sp.]
MQVSVIIVNYNTRQLTTNCIRSVYDKTKDVSFEIILVDNNSSECNASVFKAEFPDIKLIESPENTGFAKGNNLGLEHASGTYVLLLNSDTALVNDAISIAFHTMQRDSTIGVLSAQLIYPDGRAQPVTGKFPSVKRELSELFRLHAFESAHTRTARLHGDCWDYTKAVETDWVWGAFFMVSRHVLNRFPGNRLHDDFFMYLEDVQWCYFIKKRLGLNILYSPEPIVLHYLSGSTANTDFKENFRNRILPNQAAFLIMEHGKIYTVLFYFFRALHFLSLRTKQNRMEAGFYFRFIIRNVLSKKAISKNEKVD